MLKINKFNFFDVVNGSIENLHFVDFFVDYFGNIDGSVDARMMNYWDGLGYGGMSLNLNVYMKLTNIL